MASPNTEQLEIAVKFWVDLFNQSIKDEDKRIRFERSLRRILNQHRDILEAISLQVVPHYLLLQVLKDAKLHPNSLPFRKLAVSFGDNGKVYLFERDQFVKNLTPSDFSV